MGSTRPNRPMWVGLDLCNGLGWVEFFLTHHSGLGQKILSTRPMHTLRNYLETTSRNHNDKDKLS